MRGCLKKAFFIYILLHSRYIIYTSTVLLYTVVIISLTEIILIICDCMPMSTSAIAITMTYYRRQELLCCAIAIINSPRRSRCMSMSSIVLVVEGKHEEVYISLETTTSLELMLYAHNTLAIHSDERFLRYR